MPELYHKLGVGVIAWSPHSVSSDDGIQLISRRAISHEEKSFRSSKQLELNSLAVRLGCDSVQLSIGEPRLPSSPSLFLCERRRLSLLLEWVTRIPRRDATS